MKTIAILADTGNFPAHFLQALAKKDFRLLIVGGDEKRSLQIKKILESFLTSENIEFINCEREGCWEADIIILHEQQDIPPLLISKIKEVSTQKVVLVVSEEKEVNFTEILPNSKVVMLQLGNCRNLIAGKDLEANAEIQKLFAGSDFIIN